MGRHAPVGCHGKDIPQPVAADRGTQPRVGTIDFVAGHPRRGNLRSHGPVDQRDRQGGFGRETLLVFRDSGVGATDRVLGPRLGQVQRPVDQGVSPWGGIGQMHRDLGVLDAARGAAVLALYPDTVDALLDIAGLIDDQDRAWVAEGVDDIIAQIIADSISVPARAGQQVLQPIRGGCTAVLGDRPAILAVQTRDHPRHQLRGMPKWFVATKSRRDPVDHRGELRLPPIRVYAVSRGDRGVFGCLHKL